MNIVEALVGVLNSQSALLNTFSIPFEARF
jgi:hypothetical protein